MASTLIEAWEDEAPEGNEDYIIDSRLRTASVQPSMLKWFAYLAGNLSRMGHWEFRLPISTRVIFSISWIKRM